MPLCRAMRMRYDRRVGKGFRHPSGRVIALGRLMLATLFLAAIDASRVPQRSGMATEGEQIETLCVSLDDAIAAVGRGVMANGPLVVGLQWLAINRDRVAGLLAGC